LNVLALTVPPLRERRADILPLADHLLATLRSIHGHPGSHLSEAPRRMLESADFPDNIRAAASGAAGSIAGLRSLEEVEREVIAATLEATHYKISRAA